MYKLDLNRKLEPCPFCGGEAVIGVSGYGFCSTAVFIKCEECKVSTLPIILGQSMQFEGKKAVNVDITMAINTTVDSWNKRKVPCGTAIPASRNS